MATPLPLVYLLEDDAITLLEEDGLDVPDNLRRLLRGIETRIDEWLNWRPALTRYTEYLTPNQSLHLYLNHAHPKSIVSVKSRDHRFIKTSEEAIAEKEANPPVNEDTEYKLGVHAFWDNESRIRISSWHNTLNPYRRDFFKFEVVYYAGLDPLPPIFSEVVYEILVGAIDNEGSLAFLYEPTSDTQSLSLPGGLSESKKLSDTGSKNQLERFLQPLQRYRKTLFIGVTP